MVVGEPQSIREPSHNLLKLLSRESPIAGMKQDDEVIRALAFSASIGLDHVDELAGELKVVWPGDIVPNASFHCLR